MKAKGTGFILVSNKNGKGSQLVNIANITNIKESKDSNDKDITFIYFDGPGYYAATLDSLDEIERKIKESIKQ